MNTQYTKLTEHLRRAGAVILVGAGAAFMFQGWHTLTTLERYLSFLVFTLVLGGLGLVSGKVWKDPKGARTFLGIAAASLPVHFSQLGAMLYATLMEVRTDLPSLFRFGASDPVSLFCVIGAGILLMTPIAQLGISALVRNRAGKLTSLYMLGNLSLLVPVRTGWETIIGIFALGQFLLWMDRKRLSKEIQYRTKEGELARAMALIPLMILCIRTMMYPVVAYGMVPLYALFGTFLFFNVPDVLSHKLVGNISEGIGTFFFCLAWRELASQLALNYITETGTSVIPLVLSLRVKNHDGRWFRTLASIHAAFAGAMLSYRYGCEVALIQGIIFTGFGVFVKERVPFGAGMLLLVIGVAHLFQGIFDFIFISPWVSLAVIGILSLLVASMIETRADRLKVRYERLKAGLATWR